MLVSTKHQQVYSCPLLLEHPSQSHSSKLLPSRVWKPCHTANSHWLSVLHMVMYVSMLLSIHPHPELSINLFSMSVSPFSSVQLLSCVQLFATPWTTARQASLSVTNSWSPPKPMSIEFVMPSNHLILCHPLLLLPSIFPRIRVFSNESVLRMRWPMYWSFSFSISPLNEYSGLISFRMDWLDLLTVKGTLKSLLQHHSSKASILWRSAQRFSWCTLHRS